LPSQWSIPIGTLDLGVARHWDGIVEADEKSGVRFQMVLQHHGPYSSGTDSNWADNPWNVANGGFLSAPEEFFTNPRAIALTKAKYRYIIARWGYSPSVMAWELFNEVQWTDAIRNGHRDTVAVWHNDTADFLRKHDPYRHLVTSSFRMDPSELGDRLDYWQPHAYVPDPLTAASSLNGLGLDRPAFIGEIGPSGDQVGADERFLHRALWSSLVSESSGTAQFWAWDLIERRNWYRIFRPVTAFMGWSGLAEKRGLKALPLQVEMPENGPLSFAPGAEWEAAGQTEFTVTRSGEVAGIGCMPRFLQGEAHREMFPRAVFQVDFAKPGTFVVHISQVSKGGAKVALSVEAETPKVREFPAAGADRAEDVTIAIPVPAGPSTVRLENTGPDWAIVDRITLDPYAPALHALGKGSSDYVVAWVYDRAKGAFEKTGRLVIPGLAAGTYDVAWWDTESGRPFGEAKMDVAADGRLVLPSPTLSRDAAVLVRKSGW
jgi:hypothetical protein